MEPNTAPKQRATPTRAAPTGPFGLVLAILLIAMTAISAATPTVSLRDPATHAAQAPAGQGPTAPVPDRENAEAGAERLVAPTTTAPTATPAVELTMIPDPRAGDQRIDDRSDVLPVGYTPPPAATTILDLAYGPDPANRLDLYLPDALDTDTTETTDAPPVLVYLHSGGWIEGDKSAVPDMVMRFVERGYAVVSVNYRLAPDHPFPEPISDVKRAIRWLKAYADDEGTIDGDRMVLAGASAGGHLAAFVTATAGEFTPTDLPADLAAHDSTTVGLVSFVGPTDLVELYDHEHDWARAMTSAFVGCLPCDEAQLAEAGISDHLAPGLPPAYWAYGAEDPLVDALDQGASIALQWAAEGSPSWLDVVEGSGHTLDENVVNQRALETFVDLAVGLV